MDVILIVSSHSGGCSSPRGSAFGVPVFGKPQLQALVPLVQFT